ncbi:MAG: hypothetical protein H7Y59_09285 [Anaerolineales bacterium]|nr:hypothetical protein [Anaerolineales bacterium]
MKQNRNGILVFLLIALTACQSATPLPRVLITDNTEFTLAPNQEATIVSTGLVVTLLGVTSDGRCPSEIECAESGPVSLSLLVQIGNGEANEIYLQTFTDYEGRAPSMQFEGIENRIVYEGYVFQVAGVSPYPTNLEEPIKDSEYRVTLIVTQE